MKTNVSRLIAAHYATLVNNRTGHRDLRDHLLFTGLPLAILVASAKLDVNLSPTAAGGLLTVSGLLSAFLFSVMLQVAERATDWSDSGPVPSRETTEHAEFLREISANAGYAALVSIVAAVVFVIAAVTTKTPNTIASSTGLAIGAHMLLVLLMVIVRVFALTESRLRRATTGTGGSVTRMDDRRAG